MKKSIVALALAAFASAASAAIQGGSHDLTRASYGNSTTLPACQYCHAPHLWNTANVSGGPLWNRNAAPATNYTVYTSSTISQVPSLGTASLVCLGCHDGTVMTAVNNGTTPAGALRAIAAYAVVGTNLSTSHPVGVSYTVGTGYANVSANANVKLYASRVECGSCHDPHGTSDGARGGAVFARWGTGVDLCAQCHLK